MPSDEAAPPGMRYRQFGRTGVDVSEIGFGAWAIGGQSYGPVDRRESLRALALAEEAGCNFVDTAAVYGDSEHVLGAFLRGRRDKWLVATKYSGQPAGVARTAEEQLRRLGTDVIDFYQLHWAPGARDARLYEDLYELKESGKTRFIGVSLYSAANIGYALERAELDGFQIAFSLIDPLPFLRCLDRIRAKQPAVVVRSSLKSGFLTGKFPRGVRFTDQKDHRSKLSRSELDRILNLVDAFRFLEQGSRSLARAAALYPLSFSEVSTEILGTKSVSQAEENFRRISGSPLTATELQAIAEVQKTEGLMKEHSLVRVRTALGKIRSLLRSGGNER